MSILLNMVDIALRKMKKDEYFKKYYLNSRRNILIKLNTI